MRAMNRAGYGMEKGQVNLLVGIGGRRPSRARPSADVPGVEVRSSNAYNGAPRRAAAPIPESG